MINREDVKKDPSNGQHWMPILEEVELFFEPINPELSDEDIILANKTIDISQVLYGDAIKYIDHWVDRNKEGVGIEHELHSILLNTMLGHTTICIHFIDDHESLWWVRFANPSDGRIGEYWPQEFGRKQL